MEMENFINLSKAAALLGVHSATVARWIDNGKLKGNRVAGGPRIVLAADVERLAQQLREQK